MSGRQPDPGDTRYRDAMRTLIGERWEAVWKAVPVAMQGEDTEGVHDVRVASRRLRAAMDVAHGAFPNDWYRPLHKLAKQITRELGAVRDRDVLIEALQKDRDNAPPEEWPGIDLVIQRIDRERQAARAEMEAFLEKLERSGMIEETRGRFGRADTGSGKTRRPPKTEPERKDARVSKPFTVEGLDPKTSLAENARIILKVRIAEYYHYTPIVHDEHAGVLLHELRIAAKRLRYTLEMFRQVFGEEGERQIERVKAIQEVLGELHDCDVRIELIEDELVELAGRQMRELSERLKREPIDRHRSITSSALRPPPDDPRRGLLALLSRQHLARHAFYEQFVQRWDANAAEGMRAELVALSQSPARPEPAIVQQLSVSPE